MDQAEKLRNIIKSNSQQQHLARVITVTSGKGGVGKSSVSINLAIQLSRAGNRVIILDADFGLANIEVMLGIRPKYSLADLMFRGRSLKDIITMGPENIGFISGGSGIRELLNLTKDQVMSLVDVLFELDSIADVIIIDTGAGISDAVLEFVAASSEVLLVTTPEPTSITDAYALLKTLNKRKGFIKENTKIKIVGNRIQKGEEGKELFEKLSAVVNKFLGIQLYLIGLIPYDNYYQKAIMKQSPVTISYPNAPSSRAMQDIALILNENKNQSMIERRGIRFLFSSVLKMKTQRL